MLGEGKNHLKRGAINSIIGGFIISVNDNAIISIPKVYGKRLAHSFHRRYFGVFTTVDHQRKSDRRDFLNCEEGAARDQLSDCTPMLSCQINRPLKSLQQ